MPEANGYDVKEFAPVLHNAIDANNVDDLKKTGNQAGRVVAKRAMKEAIDYATKATQQTGGALKLSFAKGSQEAKDRMAKVRAMKGNGILKDIKKFGRTKIGRTLKNIGKTALKGVANATVDGLATYALGNPIAGSIVGSVANDQINKKIDGLGIGHYINANAGGGDGTLLRRSVPRKKSGAVRGGSFISY